jgi:transposase
MKDIKITDEQWQKIEPHLSKQGKMGRPRADDRRTLEAILYVLVSGCRWVDLPQEYGNHVTAWRRLQTWSKDGSLAKVWQYLLLELERRGGIDMNRCSLDGSYVRAKKGAPK